MYKSRRLNNGAAHSLLLLVCVAIFCGAAFIALSPLAPIGTSSEAREAQIVQVIVREQEWILPTRNGLLPSKPPLHHWLAAGIGTAFGHVNEFVARVPSAFSAALTLLLTGLLASGLVRRSARAHTSVLLGLIAMAILGTTYGFTYMATDARVDMLCTCCMMLACSVVLRRLQSGVDYQLPACAQVRQEDLFWFFFWCGMAVLAKGPLGIVLPVVMTWGVASACLGLRDATRALLRPSWGWLVFLCISVPWYFAASQLPVETSELQAAQGLIQRQLIFENVSRFFGGENVNAQAFWFYVPSFLRVAAPWAVLFALFLLRDFSRRKDITLLPAAEQRLEALRRGYARAFLLGFLLFSLASGKRHSYLLPLFPFMSVYLAASINDWVASRTDVGRMRLRTVFHSVVLLSMAAFLLIATFLSTLTFPLVIVESESLALLQKIFAVTAYPLMCLSALGALLLGVLSTRPEWTAPQRYLSIVAMSGTLLFGVAITLGNTAKNELKGFRHITHEIASRLNGASLAVVRTKEDEHFDPILFYINRNVTLLPPRAEDVPCSEGDEKRMILAKREFFDEFLRRRATGTVLREFHIMRTLADEAQQVVGREIVLFSCEYDQSMARQESAPRVDEPRQVLGT